jgi:nicotinate-nucleotide pyrophosphorylase (carboxylating)
MLPFVALDAIIDHALLEDLRAGDITSSVIVDTGVRARAIAVAHAPMVVCGGPVFARLFERIEPGSRTTANCAEGARVSSGQPLWTVEGTALSLLSGERTALNFVQRMSGIATMARTYVDALPKGSKVRITDTRKTTPGLRLLDRYSVRTGGAVNHRNDLSSAVLIKDNHIVAAGGIDKAVARARATAPHICRIEVEVESTAELDLALAAGADVIMLDNFDLPRLYEAVRQAAGRAILEASGGITLENVAAVAETGIDVISIGALTHSSPAIDISIDLELLK